MTSRGKKRSHESPFHGSGTASILLLPRAAAFGQGDALIRPARRSSTARTKRCCPVTRQHNHLFTGIGSKERKGGIWRSMPFSFARLYLAAGTTTIRTTGCRATVDYWADRGVTSFKVYTNISQDTLAAVTAEAHRRTRARSVRYGYRIRTGKESRRVSDRAKSDRSRSASMRISRSSRAIRAPRFPTSNASIPCSKTLSDTIRKSFSRA